MTSSRNPVFFYAAIVVAVLAVALAVYYYIPGVYHPLTTTASHVKHALAFGAVAVLSIVAALVTRPKAVVR